MKVWNIFTGMELRQIYHGKNKILINVLFWGILWLLIPLFSANVENYDAAISRMAIVAFGVIILVWANLSWLMPEYFFKKEYAAYVLISIFLIMLVNALTDWLTHDLLRDVLPPFEDLERFRKRFQGRSRNFSAMRYLISAMPFLISFVGSSLFEIINFANRKERETIQLRNEKLNTEMKFLRSQINPHFLFNAINNIYALTVIKSDAAPDNLLKLSGMLRYMLYECNVEKVPLFKEIDYIRNYIDLMLLKDSKGLNVKTQIDDTQSDLKIAPLLLIPFIENAFKHSKIENPEQGWIEIKLTTIGSDLHFKVANSFPENEFAKDKIGGIGLKNVKRRLELLYPDKHELLVEKQEGIQFNVSLKINLQ